MNVNQRTKKPNEEGKNLGSLEGSNSNHTPPAKNVHRSYPRGGSIQSLTTEQLASELGICAQSIRKRFSQTGSYFNLQPIKLPNRRLLWPANAFDLLINGSV